MSELYRFRVARGLSRQQDGDSMSDWNDTGFRHLVLERDAHAAMERALVSFGQNVDGLLFLDAMTRSRAGMADPAAMILLPRDYWLSGHVLEVRGARKDVKFTYCSYRPDATPLQYPPVSLVYVPDREILATLSEKSPIFAAGWSLVRDQDASEQWLCITDPLPEPWASDAERADRALFNRLIAR